MFFFLFVLFFRHTPYLLCCLALIKAMHGEENCTVVTFLQHRISGKHYESASH